MSQDINFIKAEKLARVICNKSVEYSPQFRFSQTSTTIKAHSHWAETVHEIAHWIACDPEYRHLDNLGFSVERELNNKRMHYEESVALIITKLLADNFFEQDLETRKYIEYMDNRSQEISNDWKFDQENIKQTAQKLFNQHTCQVKDLALEI